MRIRRRLVAVAFDSIAVLAALLLLCVAIAFLALTATAAQLNSLTKSPAVSETRLGHSVSRWQDVATGWQNSGQFGERLFDRR